MKRRLIVTADDFGMSREVNEAVEEAHRKGVLTCASLVVSGAAAEDAVHRARRMPGLGVGLHLALFGAQASFAQPSPLARDGANLGASPVSTGIAIMVSPAASAAARREIAAQFDAYRKTGLKLGHLDGHWHCHQHPAVLAMAIEAGLPLGLKAVRVPHEAWGLSRRVAGQALAPRRLADALPHWPLAYAMRRRLRAAGLACNDHFFGKNDAGAIDEALLLRLVENLPRGATELGLHPATRTWRGPHAPPTHWRQGDELVALTSPRLREAIDGGDIELIRWEDLS